jgi:hypothetical protein
MVLGQETLVFKQEDDWFNYTNYFIYEKQKNIIFNKKIEVNSSDF